MTKDDRTKALDEIFEIFNKYKLTKQNMIGICCASLTGILTEAINEQPKLKSAYLTGVSRCFDYLLERVDETKGEKLEK